jgi:hypothetical protein
MFERGQAAIQAEGGAHIGGIGLDGAFFPHAGQALQARDFFRR